MRAGDCHFNGVHREALLVPREVGELSGPSWLRRPTTGPASQCSAAAALNTERAAELGTQIAEGKKTAPTRPHPHTPLARRAQDGRADCGRDGQGGRCGNRARRLIRPGRADPGALVPAGFGHHGPFGARAR
jgi:hypothetical protein